MPPRGEPLILRPITGQTRCRYPSEQLQVSLREAADSIGEQRAVDGDELSHSRPSLWAGRSGWRRGGRCRAWPPAGVFVGDDDDALSLRGADASASVGRASKPSPIAMGRISDVPTDPWAAVTSRGAPASSRDGVTLPPRGATRRESTFPTVRGRTVPGACETYRRRYQRRGPAASPRFRGRLAPGRTKDGRARPIVPFAAAARPASRRGRPAPTWRGRRGTGSRRPAGYASGGDGTASRACVL